MKNGHEFDRNLWYYLAGPMTGYPKLNYPAFEKAVALLEEEGIKVASPHTIDHGQHEFKAKHSVFCCDKMVDGYSPASLYPYGQDCGKPAGDPIHSEELGVLPYPVYLKAGYRMLLNCGGIILLKGWTESTGAKYELYIAKSLKYPVFTLGEDFLMELSGSEH